MEETLEEKVPVEVKVPDDDQGGIGRRLRDRDLLRKRKAEAEERATNQAQTSKRAKRETNNVPRKKGRPRKNIPVKEQQPETTEVPHAGELETPSQAEEKVTAPHSAPIPTQVSAPALDLPQIPAEVSVPIPLPPPEVSVPIPLPPPDVIPEVKPSSEALPEQVLIEELSPDEEEDKVEPQDKLVIDQGGVEEVTGVGVDAGEQNKVFSDTVLASPQPEPLPGNLI